MQFVAAAVGVLGLLSQLGGGAAAKKDAAKAAANEAKLEGIVTQSKVAGLEAEQRQMASSTKAMAAGSGVSATTGSPLQILAEQAREFGREIMTVRKAGASRAAQAQTRGRMTGNQAMYQGFSQAASSASNVFSLFAKG